MDLTACEMEVWLSVDGGNTFPMWISPWLNAKAQSFDWIVPEYPYQRRRHGHSLRV
jgi:hypothetical protein